MQASVSAASSFLGRSRTIPSVDVTESTKPMHMSLGGCPFGESLRNIRHRTILNMMAETFRDYGYTVYEEVHGVATNGSNKRIDIIAFRPSSKIGMILDHAIRFETHNGQPE
ncbi:hypothetical protein L9F63_016254 [Diploptera punctata]|uniref:Uncharacterized protein n=1 Tax=Diploptera punctata TaxID=6984 RepID=A0AAD8A3H1_DIPPU|nr:hypothetical protein L9F63_016254 [Diploptera punctata]